MRIPGQPLINPSQLTSDPPKDEARKPEAVTPKPAGLNVGAAVRFTVSDEARKLAEGARTEFDEALVAKLRAAIQDGTFVIDAIKIAEKINAK